MAGIAGAHRVILLMEQMTFMTMFPAVDAPVLSAVRTPCQVGHETLCQRRSAPIGSLLEFCDASITTFPFGQLSCSRRTPHSNGRINGSGSSWCASRFPLRDPWTLQRRWAPQTGADFCSLTPAGPQTRLRSAGFSGPGSDVPEGSRERPPGGFYDAVDGNTGLVSKAIDNTS
jgi:hypothetical protein